MECGLASNFLEDISHIKQKHFVAASEYMFFY